MSRPVASFCRLLFCIVLVVLVAACDRSPPPVLRVGTSGWMGYQPLHLAAELNYFKRPGRFRIIEYSSDTQTLRAFRNGSVEAATVTLDEALLLAEDVPDLKVVLVMDSSRGADAVLSHPHIAQLSELRGRRIGYEATAMGAYMLGRAVDQAGLQLSEVTLVPVQIDEHEKAFTNGLVDAIVTYEPTRSRLLSIGVKELFSSAQIPNEIFDVLVVRLGHLKEYPEEVELLLSGWFKALDYQRQSPDDAIFRLSKRLGFSAEEARNAYRMIVFPSLAENRSWLSSDPSVLRTTADRVGAIMLRHQLLHRLPDSSHLFDGRFLGQIKQTP